MRTRIVDRRARLGITLVGDDGRRRPPREAPAALVSLTPREREVLEQVATGRSNAEIATELFVSEETVRTHVARMLGKLGLRDRVQAVVFAYENGVVTP